MNINYVTGQVSGTGALITIGGERCGFRPRKVTVYDTTNHLALEWLAPMADGTGIKITTQGVRSLEASGAITPTDDGFTIGTTAVNASAASLVYEAWP